jgi:hypothetical protein
MFIKTKYLIIIMLIVVLAGCGMIKPIVVTKDINILISPPDQLLENCNISPPPDKNTYLNSDWENREGMLMTYSRLQITNIVICNERMGNLREWKKRQELLMQNKEK